MTHPIRLFLQLLLLLALLLLVLTSKGCGKTAPAASGGQPGGGESAVDGVGPGPPPADLSVPGAAKFVDPAGDDAADGSESTPWRTLTRSLRNLQAGDVLVVRGGRYFEREVPVSLVGTAGSPIVIQNAPGQHPILDGGYPEFRTIDNTDWQLHDATRAIYRSALTFDSVGAAFGYFQVNGRAYRLVPYESMATLSADQQDYVSSGPYYCGPGAYWNSADRRFYIRLQPSAIQQRLGFGGLLATTDPSKTPVYLFGDRQVLRIQSATRHVVWHGVALLHGGRIADVPGSVQNLTLRNCEIRAGRYGFVIRDGAGDLVFDHLRFGGAFPPWVARSDIKAANNPAHSMQDAAFEISGAVTGVEISNCTFTGWFDGIDTYGRPQSMTVRNCSFDTVRDDAIEVATGGHDIEIHHNLMNRVTAGVSWNGPLSPMVAGAKYIHHNIIDTSGLQLYARDDPNNLLPTKWRGPAGDGMATGPIFGIHDIGGVGSADPWKVYCNTFIGGADVDGEGLGVAYPLGFTSSQYPHELCNNILVQSADQWIVRGPTIDDGSQRFDGNIYHRQVASPSSPLMANIRAGSRSRDYGSLAALLASAEWMLSRGPYPPGWESSGVEGDPLLGDNYRPSVAGPAASGGVDLSSTGWPGVGAARYRGAISPLQ
jgi:hypothetical protein